VGRARLCYWRMLLLLLLRRRRLLLLLLMLMLVLMLMLLMLLLLLLLLLLLMRHTTVSVIGAVRINGRVRATVCGRAVSVRVWAIHGRILGA
jgi:hypothetical protein